MGTETKTCQNCKKDFTIELDDFSFYEKMKVPAPTFCPECQFIRRMVFRNQNTLYHRKNNAPGSTSNKIISIYSDDKDVVVYDRDSWWSDKWDAYSYGVDYDFSRPFFDQLSDLIKKVPWPNLLNWNSVNSDYCNFTTDNKNCYLIFGGDYNQDCSYSIFNFNCHDTQDVFLVEKCEYCYECVDCQECYRTIFSQNSKNCLDCMFLYDCVNCNNCIGCVGLRNKSYCIFNQQYTKDEYEMKVKELDLNTRNGLEKISKEFQSFKLKNPHRYAQITKSENCTGNNIVNSKNCLNCFDIISNSKDLKNVFLSGGNLADARNMSHAGHNSELIYDSFAVFGGCKNIRFSALLSACIDTTYSYHCHSSFNIFGCVGIRDGNYVILNKKYTKKEYNEILPKIIKHMSKMPYIDKNGREYKFGEFFPADLSPFAYNETIAYDYYPLTKEKTLEQNFKWQDREEKNYKFTISSENIPESINEVSDSIFDEILECSHKGMCQDQCTTAFKIIPQELQFYRRLNLPLPVLCPNCRNYRRLKQRNPLKLWHRKCMKEGCTNEFETSYAPDRPEIVYCERCYQQEVY